MSKEEEIEEDEEESELEEEIEEEPEVDNQKLQNLLQTNVRSSPVLEQVEVANESIISLEQELEQETTFNKKDDDTKYETIKDPSEDYEDPNKRQNQISGGEVQTISASSHIDMANVGRQPERIGQEFHMSQPEELSQHPASARNYETIQGNDSGKFEGEKTAFQKQMERRYETNK